MTSSTEPDLEQPSEKQEDESHVVTGVPVYTPDDNYDEDPLCSKKSFGCLLKLGLFVAGIVIVAIAGVLYLTIGGMDQFSLLGGGESVNSLETAVGADGTDATQTMAPSLSPILPPSPTRPSAGRPVQTQSSPTNSPIPTTQPSQSPEQTQPSPSPLQLSLPTQSPVQVPPPPTIPAMPTSNPSVSPSIGPTSSPTTRAPTTLPTRAPTTRPTSIPLFQLYTADVPDSIPLQSDLADMRYGSSVSLSHDGSIMAVATADGEVQVYAFDGVSWLPRGSSIPGAGQVVVLSGNGMVLALGAPNVGNGNGRIAVAEYVNGDWARRGQLLRGVITTVDAEGLNTGGSRLGGTMALSYDGNVLVTSEPLYDKASGRVTRYDFDANSEWAESTNFVPTYIPNPGDAMGQSLSLSRDGALLAVGSPGATNSNGNIGAGQVHVYEYDGIQTQQVGDTQEGDQASGGYGNDVALYQHSSGKSVLLVLSRVGQLFVLRLNGGGSKWIDSFKTPFPAQRYASMALGYHEASNKVTVALGIYKCNNAISCLDETQSASKALIRLFQPINANNLKQWERIGDEILQGGKNLNGFPMAMSLSRDAMVVAAGIPGSDASGVQRSGEVIVYHRQDK